MTKSFIQATDALFGAQLRNFYIKLISLATLLGFNTEELTEAKDDSLYWDYLMDADNKVQKYAKDFKKTKKLAKDGVKSEILSGIPEPPDLGTAPHLVPANIKLRFRQKAAKAKANPKYTKAIGTDLGIEPIHQTFDPQLGKPALKIKMNADRPILTYVKKAYQGSVIYKDTGDGYTYLGTAFKSKFEDNSDLPEPGKSAIWKYKAIFVWDGKETGHWSDEITIVVKG